MGRRDIQRQKSDWNLHSAIPVANSTPRTRKLLQRLVLGATARETAGSILLILGPSERSRRFGSSTDSVRTVSSASSNSPKPASKGDVKRLQTKVTAIAAELKSLRDTDSDRVIGADAHMAPIRFKDAVGRKFNFSWHYCKTWKGMETLIKQCFLHVDVIGAHVQEGHYDLMGPDGMIILPQLWETMIRPDWEITMYMWPIPEPPKKDKKMKKAKSDWEPPNIFDPNSEPVIDKPFTGIDAGEIIDLSKPAKKKGKEKDKPKASNPIYDPILETYPPMPSEPPQAVPIVAEMPPVASSQPQSAPVTVEMPTRLRHDAFEERIKEAEVFPQRRSTRAAKNIVPASMTTPMVYSGIDGDSAATKRKDDDHTTEYVLDEGTAFQEDSDAEDALLDDEALKNKMLMKYAGGVEAVDEPEPAACRTRCIPYP